MHVIDFLVLLNVFMIDLLFHCSVIDVLTLFMYFLCVLLITWFVAIFL